MLHMIFSMIFTAVLFLVHADLLLLGEVEVTLPWGVAGGGSGWG